MVIKYRQLLDTNGIYAYFSRQKTMDLKPIKATIKGQKLSIKELSALTGLHRETISNALHGQNVSVDTIEKILDCVGLELKITFKQP